MANIIEMPNLGEILIKEKLISSKELNFALAQQKETSEPLGRILINLGLIKEEDLFKALAKQMHMEFYSKISEIEISLEVIERVPIRLVSLYKFMPLNFIDNVLTIAISDPFDVWLVQGIKNELHCQLHRVIAPQKEILEAIKKYYGIGAETVDKILDKKEAGVEKVSRVTLIEDLEKSAQDVSVIRLVNQIIAEAISNRATDIHLEPYRGSARVRQRIDGVLYEMKVPEEIRYLYPAIVSRIKILSALDVIERRLPQDGRAKVKVKDKEIDLRISILPSPFGENVVIRILPTSLLFSFSDLGFLSQHLEKLRRVIRKPHGIIFLTGPTGSGKTTTLYASLTEINSKEVKIITIEDPIEYELEGITQIQVNPKVGLTFATALRSILRHDPDIMMVGEVRDPETAELAIRSSLTGHLVFSTLHTNDSASGVARLLDMDIEPYLVASSVEVLISQRLLRVICEKCKSKVSTSKLKNNFNLGEFIYEGKGCQACNFTGFFGRTVIYEMLIVGDEIKKLILNRAPTDQIREKAQELGMKTLKENGLEKVKKSITTLGEVMRVIEL